MFDWDEFNIAHIALHNVTPREVDEVLENAPFRISEETRKGEERLVRLGETNAGRVLLIVTTQRGELTRPITAYEKRELRKFYAEMKELQDAEDD